MKRKQNTKTNNIKKILNNIKTTDKVIISIVSFIILITFLLLLGISTTLILLSGNITIILISYILNKLMNNHIGNIVMKIISILFLILIIVCSILGCFVALDIVKSAPEFDQQLLKKRESSIIYDQNDIKIKEVGEEKRNNIKYNQVSENLINAIIATEDSRFFIHNGIDAPRFFKAAIGQLIGHNSGGASTLSMQVIKNTYTDIGKEKKKGINLIKRKFTDMYLSVFKLEKKYSKREIFEFYINNNQLNYQASGVEKASNLFFNKKAKDLTISEAALIAGLFQAPSSYNPFVYPEKAEQRRNTVLYLMERHGYITKEERKAAELLPVARLFNPHKSSINKKYQGYIDTVISELKDKGYNPYEQSLKVYTNMDPVRQEQMENAVQNSKRFKNDKMQIGTAVVKVDNGKILAIIAGRNRRPGDFNNATQNKRQIGSTAKPIFDYAPGMEYNGWGTAKAFEDKPTKYKTGQEIFNNDFKYMGMLDVCKALAWSRNTIALQAFNMTPNNKIYNMVTSMGITPEVSKNNNNLFEAHALGAFSGTTPLQLASAYATFANGGTYYKPFSIRKVVNTLTGESKEFKPDGKKVMSDSTAYMITYCLEYNGKHGYGHSTNPGGVTYAVKSGTTNFDVKTLQHYHYPSTAVNDFWLASYDTEVSQATWVGYLKNEVGYYMSQYDAWGNIYALHRHEYDKLIHKSSTPFKVPNSVVQVKVLFPSQPELLAAPNAPVDGHGVIIGYYKKGTEPDQSVATVNKLNNVSNVKHNVESKELTLSWSPVETPKNAKDNEMINGRFGYRIYRETDFIGFTTEAKFTYKDNKGFYAGKYTIVTCFENTNNYNSTGVSIRIKENVNTTLKVPAKTLYSIGDSLKPYDVSPSVSDVETKLNGQVIQPYANVVISQNNTQVKTINTDKEGTYIIKYSLIYNNVTIDSIEREVIIK